MEDDDRYTRITLRIPKELHGRLTEAAEATSKSLNAEIVGRIQSSFEQQTPEQVLAALKELAVKIADERGTTAAALLSESATLTGGLSETMFSRRRSAVSPDVAANPSDGSASMLMAANLWVQIRALERKRSDLQSQIAVHQRAIDEAHHAYRSVDPNDIGGRAKAWFKVNHAEAPVAEAKKELRIVEERLNDLYDAVSTEAPGAGARAP